MLKNKVIVVAGAAGVIGNKIAQFLIERKAKVILVDRNKKILNNFIRDYKIEKNQIICIDLCSQKNVKKLIKYSKIKFNKIDAAINCLYPKSSNWGKSFIDIKENFLFQDLNNQLGATIFFATEFSKYFSREKNGNLILFSSIQGFMAPKFEHYKNLNIKSPIEYSAIKSGIISITKYLAKYLKGKNIRVNCISPGGIEDNQSKKFKLRYKKSCLNKGLLQSEDIIGLVSFLLSEDSKYINGQNIVIDDGWSL